MSDILSKSIGVAGCGAMGIEIAKLLIKKKIDVSCYDIRDKKNFNVIKNNFIADKKKFIEKNEVILSILRDINQTNDLCNESNGVFSSKSNKILLICSTLSPADLKRLNKKAPKNITLIDTPMSGAPIGAKKGTLTFMVGANKKSISFIFPLLNILGNKIITLNNFGLGMTAKVLNNFIAATSLVSLRNVIADAEKYNIPMEKLLEVVNSSSGKNWFSENFNNISYIKENFSNKNTIGLLLKDVKIYLDQLDKNKKSNLLYDGIVDGLVKLPRFPFKDGK